MALLLAACTIATPDPVTTSNAPMGGAGRPEAIIGGTALPAGYRIDAGRSLILGGGDNWTGRLTYTASGSADDVFDFLRREMPNFGWTEITAVRADINLLSFVSEATSRVATVQIERGSMIGGTRVDMIVSPANTPPRSATAPARGGSRTPPAAPISRQPTQ